MIRSSIFLILKILYKFIFLKNYKINNKLNQLLLKKNEKRNILNKILTF